MAERPKLKVRTSGISVAHAEHDKIGTIWNLKGSNLVKVLWELKDGEQSGGEYRVGADEKNEEHYDLLLNAVHSYIKVSGAAQGEDGDEDAQSLNGIYVFRTDGFIPEYHQIKGKGRISFDVQESNWVLWNTFFGTDNYFYTSPYREDFELPEKDWEPHRDWEEEYRPLPTITKHELQVGQDVKLRKHHPDNHIPAEKYPGAPCPFNDGDICTVERIEGLFFAPKISPDQWIPLRAAIPTSELEKLPSDDCDDCDDDTPTRLTKKAGAGASKKPKKAAMAGAKEAAAGSGANAIKLIKTLVEKVENLETEVKKLQK
eukprot:Skav215812  [mRNA]  locus=scaffold3449:8421:9408:- [translate_table: standard]